MLDLSKSMVTCSIVGDAYENRWWYIALLVGYKATAEHYRGSEYAICVKLRHIKILFCFMYNITLHFVNITGMYATFILTLEPYRNIEFGDPKMPKIIKIEQISLPKKLQKEYLLLTLTYLYWSILTLLWKVTFGRRIFWMFGGGGEYATSPQFYFPISCYFCVSSSINIFEEKSMRKCLYFLVFLMVKRNALKALMSSCSMYGFK